MPEDTGGKSPEKPGSEKNGHAKTSQEQTTKAANYLLPLKVALGCLVAGAAFWLGSAYMQSEWAAEVAFADAVFAAPPAAFELAEQGVAKGWIDVSAYGQLLRTALSSEDPDRRMAALGSIDRMKGDGHFYDRVLLREIKSTPLQISIHTTAAGVAVGRDVGSALKGSATDAVVVFPVDAGSSGIKETAVVCHDAVVCEGDAKVAVDLLKARGYDVAAPKDESAKATERAKTDEIAALLEKKRLEVFVADAKPTPARVSYTTDQVNKAIQTALANAGFSPGAIDGNLGKMTTDSIKRFQKARNLPVSGHADAPTLTALGLEGINEVQTIPAANVAASQ